ncbi:MAG TPA: efflux RND transporter periplasmic adaptor subunit [Candidatus Acidoferrales bacterium]|nr:efflux RND transporter periplasmic adaptor subunit [Candidatus Acidoferrales bacterium]
MKQPVWIPLLLIAGTGIGCGQASHSTLPPVAESKPSGDFVIPADAKGVQTATLVKQEIPDYLEIPGKIQPDPARVVRVFPPVGGRVTEMKVRPGDHVEQGQTLAVLESSDVSGVRSDYQKAMADAEVKERISQRASLLYENQVLSEREFHQAQADAEIAKAELQRAQARLRQLGLSPDSASDRFEVKAPRKGVVLDIGAALGEFSKSLDAPAPLCTLADLSSVWAVGELYEKDLSRLHAGTPAQVIVSAYAGQKWNAPVSTVSDALDPVTRTLKLRIVLANPGTRLKPEMFATIRLKRSTFSGIVLPVSAVLREGPATYVYLQKAAGHFERRDVTLGRALDRGVEVISGLAPGDVVVTEGALLLRSMAS